MLDPEFKAKWLADLKSGVYRKTVRHLKDDVGYCCLGVALCTLGMKFEKQGDRSEGFMPQRLDHDVLVPDVQHDGEYEGRVLNVGNNLSTVGLYLVGLTVIQAYDLMELNDEHPTFDPVIDYIEKEL